MMNYRTFIEAFKKQLSEIESDYSIDDTLYDLFSVTIGNGTKKIALLSGLHGDEYSGALAMLEMLKNRLGKSVISDATILMVPIVNKEGWEQNSRAFKGIDLNKNFRLLPDTPDMLLYLMSILEKFAPDVLLDFHESDRPLSVIEIFEDDMCQHVEDVADFVACPIRYLERRIDGEGSAILYAKQKKCPHAMIAKATKNLSLDSRIIWAMRVMESVIFAD